MGVALSSGPLPDVVLERFKRPDRESDPAQPASRHRVPLEDLRSDHRLAKPDGESTAITAITSQAIFYLQQFPDGV